MEKRGKRGKREENEARGEGNALGFGRGHLGDATGDDQLHYLRRGAFDGRNKRSLHHEDLAGEGVAVGHVDKHGLVPEAEVLQAVIGHKADALEAGVLMKLHEDGLGEPPSTPNHPQSDPPERWGPQGLL